MRHSTIFINQLLHRDTFQKVDVSLQLTVSLGELILRIEMRDWDYAKHRLKEFRRKFRAQLKASTFATEARLLDILRLFGQNMSFLPDKKLEKLMDEFLEQTPYEIGSNEFISYRAWVYAKRYQRDYYEVIMDWLHPEAEGQ